MTFQRMYARFFLPALGLCLLALARDAAAQAPSSAPPPSPAAAKPAPIVRKAPAADAKPLPAAQTDDSATPAAATPPKPVHLTVAKPVVRAPQQSASPDGAPAAPAITKPKPKPAIANKPVAPKPGVPPATPGTVTISLNRTTILLDPAHGGTDAGSHITDQLSEKDVTLGLAYRLRSLLTARGFTVVMTRDNDAAPTAPGSTLNLDERAGIANHAHPVACLLLHATASGEGVHLYTSELDPIPAEPANNPWLTAQAAWVPASQHLGQQLGAALGRARLPLVTSRASIRPVDSLTCPAAVLELAPDSAGNTGSLSDGAYQQRVAEAVAGALVFWQNQAQAPMRLVPAPAPSPVAAAPPAPHPAPATPEVQP